MTDQGATTNCLLSIHSSWRSVPHYTINLEPIGVHVLTLLVVTLSMDCYECMIELDGREQGPIPMYDPFMPVRN